MPVEHDVEQRSPEWFRLRAGKATASRFDTIITPKTMKTGGKGSESYAAELAAERVVGGPLSMDDSEEGWRGFGLAKEDGAVAWYELVRDTTTREIGFIETDDGTAGCSPDRLVDDDPEGPGGLELKNLSTKVHVQGLLGLEDVATWTQVQGSMLVTGREWWDVLAWTSEPALGPVLIRHRPVKMLVESLTKALAAFELQVQKATDALVLLGRDGLTESSGLRIQLLKSLLVYGDDVPDDQLTLDEVRALSDDLWTVTAREAMPPEAFASFVASLKKATPAEVRDMAASLRASSATLGVAG